MEILCQMLHLNLPSMSLLLYYQEQVPQNDFLNMLSNFLDLFINHIHKNMIKILLSLLGMSLPGC